MSFIIIKVCLIAHTTKLLLCLPVFTVALLFNATYSLSFFFHHKKTALSSTYQKILVFNLFKTVALCSLQIQVCQKKYYVR